MLGTGRYPGCPYIMFSLLYTFIHTWPYSFMFHHLSEGVARVRRTARQRGHLQGHASSATVGRNVILSGQGAISNRFFLVDVCLTQFLQYRWTTWRARWLPESSWVNNRFKLSQFSTGDIFVSCVRLCVYGRQEAAPPSDLDAMSRYAELEALERAQKQLGDAAPNTGSLWTTSYTLSTCVFMY